MKAKELNKWIKVQKQEDLPQEKKLFKFIPCDKFDKEFIGWIDNEFNEVFFVDFDYYQIKKDDNIYTMKNNAWLTSQITHYKNI